MMANEMECGHWLDYEHWLEREKDHKIELKLQRLEIAELRAKIQAIKDIVNVVNLPNSLVHQQARALSNLGMRSQLGLQAQSGIGLPSQLSYGWPYGWPYDGLI